MRPFDFKSAYDQLLTPDLVAMLTAAHEYKGEQNLFLTTKSDTLDQLTETARIQSTDASNRIEGIITTADHLKKIVRDKNAAAQKKRKRAGRLS